MFRFSFYSCAKRFDGYEFWRLVKFRRLDVWWRTILLPKLTTDLFREQSVVPLPGGMIPPMYSANHGACYLGIPTVKKLTKLQKKKFDVNKWSTALSKNYLILYPSTKMRKLAKKLSAAKKSEKRSIIASMNKEYLSQPRYRSYFW